MIHVNKHIMYITLNQIVKNIIKHVIYDIYLIQKIKNKSKLIQVDNFNNYEKYKKYKLLNTNNKHSTIIQKRTKN